MLRHTTLAVLITFAASAAYAQDKNVERGQKLYVDQKCSVCHSIAGKGNAKGPLDSAGSKLTEEEIRQWLIAPRVMAEKTKSTRKPLMPEYTKLAKEDLDALIGYLRTLKK
jgi:mono/diheme cytochrome c family protein